MLANSIRVEKCPELGEGLRVIQTLLRELYDVLKKLKEVDWDLKKHGTEFDGRRHHYSSLGLDTLDAHYSSESLEDLQDVFSRRVEMVQNLVEDGKLTVTSKLMNNIEEIRRGLAKTPFLDHTTLCSLLKLTIEAGERAPWIQRE